MSEWKSRIAESPIWERLRSARAQLDQIVVTSEDLPDVSADLTRLQTVIQTLESRLKSADPLLLPTSPLVSMDSHLQALLSEVTSFQSNRNRAHLVNANNQLDSVLLYSAQLPLGTTDGLLEEAQSAIAVVRERSEKLAQSLSTDERKLHKQLVQLSQRVDETTQEVTTQKGRLDAAIAEYQRQFSTAEANRQSQFTEAQQARNQRLDQTLADTQKNLQDSLADAQRRLQDSLNDAKSGLNSMLQDASTKAAERNAALTTAGQEVLDKLNEFRSEAQNLLHVIGSTGMAGEYQKAANSARRGSITWQIIAIVSMVGLIVFAILTYYATQAAEVRWGGVTARVFVAITFAILAAYAARQSDRYGEIEVRNRRYQLELSSIDPYLANLPEETQQRVKVELAQKLFGNVTGPQLAMTKEFTGTAKDPLYLALSILQEFVKKRG